MCLPEALVQVPLGQRGRRQSAAPCPDDALRTALARRRSGPAYIANAQYAFRVAAQLAEIVERHYADPQRALHRPEARRDRRAGPRLSRRHAALTADPALVVAPYDAPTTHVLAIRSEHPYLANRNFRRALLYGSNREHCSTQGLLRGQTLPGFRVVSAPFPAPAAEPARATATTSRSQPREFDPRLALTLRLVAEGEIKAASRKGQRSRCRS